MLRKYLKVGSQFGIRVLNVSRWLQARLRYGLQMCSLGLSRTDLRRGGRTACTILPSIERQSTEYSLFFQSVAAVHGVESIGFKLGSGPEEVGVVEDMSNLALQVLHRPSTDRIRHSERSTRTGLCS